MTDAEILALIPQWQSEASGRSASSFWRWLKKNGYQIGKTRIERLLRENSAQLIPRRVREWEALGKNGEIVKLRHVSYDVGIDWRDVIRETVRAEVKPLPPADYKPSGNMLGVLSFPDLHLGQLSWGREVGSNYDSSIATQRYLAAAAYLIEYLNEVGVGRVLYVVGNDLMHVDGNNNTTTAGTPQDADSRWQYMLIRARRITETVVNELAKFAEVDVVIMPGNHDWHLAYALGHIIDARYSEHENVHVDNEPRDRKYRRYGKLLFGIAHGDRVRDNDLPLLMAEEAAKDWGGVVWKEWLLGHIHRKKVVRQLDVGERMGVQLTFLPSLNEMDRWHYKNGFRSKQAAEVRVYDPDIGVLHSTRHYYPVVMSNGEEGK